MFQNLNAYVSQDVEVESAKEFKNILHSSVMSVSMMADKIYDPTKLDLDKLYVVNRFKDYVLHWRVKVRHRLTCDVLRDKCVVGWIRYEYYRAENSYSKKASLSNLKNSTSINQVVLPPINGTIPYPPRTPPRNRLCKRDGVNSDMAICSSKDTLVAGQEIESLAILRTSIGHMLILQNDGNLCATGYDGNMYWCLMSHDERGGEIGGRRPYRMFVGTDTTLYFMDRDGVIYKQFKLWANASNDGYYRLTFQNDGNLVMYRGTDDSYPVWHSNTNRYSFEGEKPYEA
ncbi:hypothetical protein BGX26_001789 [Mortierella sp. AD094]|nr:hypothetical protein BGX26_001789 [Mortierella sp. AD094]